MQKQKKHCVFCFFEGLWLEKITKNQKKHKANTKPKTKTLKRLFGLASKHVFLVFILFFYFFEGLWLEKITKNPKNTKQTQNQKPKNQNFGETFWFSLKQCFFWFSFCFFFWLWNAKAEKNIVFFCFFEGLWLEKITKNQKTQSKHKTKNQKTKTLKRLFGLASKDVFLFSLCFLFFEGLWLEKITKHQKETSFSLFFAFQNPKKTRKTKNIFCD